MDVTGISSVTPAIGRDAVQSPAAGAGEGKSFGNMLTDVLHELSSAEQNTQEKVAQLATGQDVDVHDVVLAAEMESMAFNLAMQIRNKLVEGYQEIFRMQI